MYVLIHKPRKTLNNNIGISAIHVGLQEVMDVAQFVQENATKGIMLYTQERVIFSVIVVIQENVQV
jgi:hypothetical protein